MAVIPFWLGELIVTVIWIVCRITVWTSQKKIIWKREAQLLLMYVNILFIVRLVFFPLYRINGAVQPLVIDPAKWLPVKSNLVPLLNISNYEDKAESVVNIVGNLILFVPTGIILPIVYRQTDSLKNVTLAGFCMSLGIELIQLVFPNSTTDIDDLILNTLGTVVGYGIYRLFRRIGRKRKDIPD